jgi:glycosyltransferase involved in cell wall biosynthesis
MIIGIDASNIRGGGGITHLLELLKAANPHNFGFSKVIVWSGSKTLELLPQRAWLKTQHHPLLDKGLAHRGLWQYFELDKLARSNNCDLLFVPGGSSFCEFRPVVSMSQNLLPFERKELLRYGFSWTSLKMVLLRLTQGRTFRKSDGIIFLTNYAKDIVKQKVKALPSETVIIPHGIDKRFMCPPRAQYPISNYSPKRPFRILYISIINVYKHQWHVAEAMGRLHDRGLPIIFEMIGPGYPPALARLQKKLKQIDPEGKFTRYSGSVPYDDLHERYKNADLFLFASSCETFGQILTEAMSAGLPIVCSKLSALPEILGNTGLYFNPEAPDEIARVVEHMIKDHELRARLSRSSFEKAQAFSWQRCADETFSFFKAVAQKNCSCP